MVEYIFDVIKASAGEDIVITARITDEGNDSIYGTNFYLLDDEGKVVYTAVGSYVEEDIWTFEIPSTITQGLSGRFWYYVTGDNRGLNFKTPIYLV